MERNALVSVPNPATVIVMTVFPLPAGTAPGFGFVAVHPAAVASRALIKNTKQQLTINPRIGKVRFSTLVNLMERLLRQVQWLTMSVQVVDSDTVLKRC